MQVEMTAELRWLVVTTLVTGLMWVPYILNRLFEQGILTALWDPHGHTETKVPWANRMMRAHENAVENLIIFGLLVMALVITGMATEATALAAMVYFYTRMVHYIAFTLAVPVLRVVAFLVGVGAQLTIGLTVLGVI